jgi:hypothetical protein
MAAQTAREAARHTGEGWVATAPVTLDTGDQRTDRGTSVLRREGPGLARGTVERLIKTNGLRRWHNPTPGAPIGS